MSVEHNRSDEILEELKALLAPQPIPFLNDRPLREVIDPETKQLVVSEDDLAQREQAKAFHDTHHQQIQENDQAWFDTLNQSFKLLVGNIKADFLFKKKLTETYETKIRDVVSDLSTTGSRKVSQKTKKLVLTLWIEHVNGEAAKKELQLLAKLALKQITTSEENLGTQLYRITLSLMMNLADPQQTEAQRITQIAAFIEDAYALIADDQYTTEKHKIKLYKTIKFSGLNLAIAKLKNESSKQALARLAESVSREVDRKINSAEVATLAQFHHSAESQLLGHTTRLVAVLSDTRLNDTQKIEKIAAYESNTLKLSSWCWAIAKGIQMVGKVVGAALGAVSGEAGLGQALSDQWFLKAKRALGPKSIVIETAKTLDQAHRLSLDPVSSADCPTTAAGFLKSTDEPVSAKSPPSIPKLSC